MTLRVDDFRSFFAEIYKYDPFPWQERLLRKIAATGRWPGTLDLPTGSGKTAAIDIAVFHLALEAESSESRRAPVRIAFVVDRRLVVDDAFERASKLAGALAEAAAGTVTCRVAAALMRLSDDGVPLVASRLRGGIPREHSWARTPSQPTVLCSTVDQIGSRLLFRGYGVSDSMKPVHAGLIGSDCLILLDEAHLAEPFRQTLEWVDVYRSDKWRESHYAAPSGVVLLTATPGEASPDDFHLEHDDRRHPVLKKRLEAAKPARLVLDSGKARVENEYANTVADQFARANAIVGQARKAIVHFANPEHGASAPAIGIVVNRVARARAVFELLEHELRGKVDDRTIEEPILMIGPARPLDRDDLARRLDSIRTRTWHPGESRKLDKPFFIVATQCLEAGVDIDLDALISEAASLDSLRQRFGRLNRAGREIVPYAAVVITKSELSPRHEDPVYGVAIRAAWDRLSATATDLDGERVVDFGLSAFAVPLETDALAPREDAPVLLPAHVDLLSQTSPIPAADPDIALYLHGPNRQPDSITVVWRADIDPEDDDENVRRLLGLVPPRSAEAIELPVWTVRRWLNSPGVSDDLADVASAGQEDDENERWRGGRRTAFRWTGDVDESTWVFAREVRPGDTLVVPASYGGLDQFGWNPERKEPPVSDIGQRAAEPFAGRRFAVRVAPGLAGTSDDALADVLAVAVSSRWKSVREALLDLPLSEALRADLLRLDDARLGRVVAYLDAYGMDDEGRPRGVVFLAPLGITSIQEVGDSQPNTTEDDLLGSLTGFALSLRQHSEDVEKTAEEFARAAGLADDRVADLKLAGCLHDAGKVDPRFQAWLHCGDPLGVDPDRPDTILAKSGRQLPRKARESSGLPQHWRHEALSVRMARADHRLSDASDPELVLWLVGTHHGRGRSFFPHHDPEEKEPEVGPQSLAFDWRGLDWPSLFQRLRARYGVWELARMEAIVRLADHRASEMRERQEAR